jgi:hypothetical protein
MRNRTPVDAVQQGLAILAIVWQGLWLAGEWFGQDFSSGLVVTSLGLLTVSWFGVIVVTWGASERARRAMYGLNLVLLSGVAVTFLVVDSVGPAVGLSAANLLVGLAGVLLPIRISIGVVIGAAALELFVLRLGLPERPLTGDFVTVTSLIAIGTGALLARLALLRGARSAMTAQIAAADEEVRARANDAVAQRNLASERIVHETVLNTLTALGRGVVGDPLTVRERARQGADVLTAVTSGEEIPHDSTDLPHVIEAHVALLRADGIEVVWSAPVEPPVLPHDVAEAIRGAFVEAVANILRHAGAQHVWIELRMPSRGVELVIRDDGRGVQPGTQFRIGVQHVIVDAMQRVNGTARIDSQGKGTRVTLTWRPVSRDRDIALNARQILAKFTTPFLLVFWGYTAVRFAVTLGDYRSPGVDTVAFVFFTLLAGFLIWSARRGPTSVWQIGPVLLFAPLVYQLQQIAGAAPNSDWAEWSSEAIASLFIVVIGTGPFWALFAAVGVWLLIQGDIVQELLAPGFAILIAIGVFGISFRRNAQRSQEATEQMLNSRAQAEAASGVVRATRARARIVAAGGGLDLLDGIATQRLDPLSDAVRHRAVAEERLLRTAMRLDPASCELHAALGRIAVRAHERGVELDVDVVQTQVFERQSGRFEALAEELISQADGPGRITTLREDGAWVLTFVVQGPHSADNLQWRYKAPFSVVYVPEERLWFVEWRESDAPGDR